MGEVLTIIISVAVSILSAFLGVAAWIRGLKNDSVSRETRITALENKIESVQEIVNSMSVAELARMQQVVKDLSKRVEKLDTDVEKKIDQLGEKVDTLMGKMQEILLELAKK